MKPRTCNDNCSTALSYSCGRSVCRLACSTLASTCCGGSAISLNRKMTRPWRSLTSSSVTTPQSLLVLGDRRIDKETHADWPHRVFQSRVHHAKLRTWPRSFISFFFFAYTTRVAKEMQAAREVEKTSLTIQPWPPPKRRTQKNSKRASKPRTILIN